jgi:hypothetical protein
MSQLRDQSWYEPGNVEQSLRAAFQRDEVTANEIVDVLGEHELDASRDRILEMVETTRQQFTNTSNDSLLPTPSLDGTRENQARFITLDDLEYLGSRDVAYLVGIMLSRFEGSFQVPELVDKKAADLLWTRSDTTVGFWLEWRPNRTPVDKADIQSVVNDATQSASDEKFSEIAIISNAGFSDQARKLASEHDIACCGPKCLRRWCQDTQITNTVAGEILDGENKSNEDIKEILNQLPPLPASLPTQDPLKPVTKTEWTTSTLGEKIISGDGTSEKDQTESAPPSQSGVSEPEPASEPGQKGVLYADPEDDGDFDAFNRFANDLAEEDDS